MKGMKIQFTINVEYFKTVFDAETNENSESVQTPHFTSKMAVVINSDYRKQINDILRGLVKRTEEFESYGS